MSDEDDNMEPEDVVDTFENTPEGELKNQLQEESLSNEDFDYNQGFSSSNYPEPPIKDSITKFYRDVISLMVPKKVVRVANTNGAEKKNCKLCLDMAFYNKLENSDVLMKWWEEKCVNQASVTMGYKGFIVTSIMTQRRIVQRQTDKATQAPSAKNWNKPKG